MSSFVNRNIPLGNQQVAQWFADKLLLPRSDKIRAMALETQLPSDLVHVVQRVLLKEPDVVLSVAPRLSLTQLSDAWPELGIDPGTVRAAAKPWYADRNFARRRTGSGIMLLSAEPIELGSVSHDLRTTCHVAHAVYALGLLMQIPPRLEVPHGIVIHCCDDAKSRHGVRQYISARLAGRDTGRIFVEAWPWEPKPTKDTVYLKVLQ